MAKRFFFPILQIENLLLKVYPLNGDLHFLSRRGLRRLVARCGFETVAQRRAACLARYTVARKRDMRDVACAAEQPV